MDGVGAGQFGDAQDFVDRQVAFDRAHLGIEMGASADLIGFVRLEAVQRQLVLFRPDGDGLQPQFIGRAKDANGDFGAVGDEYLRDRHG